MDGYCWQYYWPYCQKYCWHCQQYCFIINNIDGNNVYNTNKCIFFFRLEQIGVCKRFLKGGALKMYKIVLLGRLCGVPKAPLVGVVYDSGAKGTTSGVV